MLFHLKMNLTRAGKMAQRLSTGCSFGGLGFIPSTRVVAHKRL